MTRMIDHIGIAVRSLEERIPFYRDVLKLGEPELEEVTDQKVRTAVFFLKDGGRLELLEGTDPTSPISRFIEKRGEGIHHVALSTADINQEISFIEAVTGAMIDKSPKTGAGGVQVAFVHPKATGGVLLELCQ